MLSKDEVNIEHWMKQAMEAMEVDDGGKALGRVLDRIPEEHKKAVMASAIQWSDTLSEMDKEMEGHVGTGPGTEAGTVRNSLPASTTRRRATGNRPRRARRPP